MKLHFQEYGEGPPLIILHGLFGMLDNWHTVSRILGERFRVYALDQRNHGRSPHSVEFNYPVMAADVRDFIAEHNLPTCFLLGHSMGGKTAMWTALSYPQLIERLVVIDISTRAYPSLHDSILDALDSVPLSDMKSRQDVDHALSAQIAEAPVRQFLMKNLARREDGAFRWKMNLPVISSQYGEIMKGVDIDAVYSKPTLFVRSRRSSYISDRDTVEIRKFFPSSTFVDFDTGHWVHAEAPGQLTTTVAEFLLGS